MRTKLLFAASILLLTATAYTVATYGSSVYFVAFHKPLHASLTSYNATSYSAPALPSFTVRSSIAAATLAPGKTETITLIVTPHSSIPAYVKVWVEGPLHTQVYRSPTNGRPVSFVNGGQQTLVYHYRLPDNLPEGTYAVSAILTSANNQTDYYVHTNFATFTVS